ANKVFTLSKHHPVGIMLYNSASFMGTPWETIIKVYRKQLGEKSFPLLKDYQNDFIEFIKSKSYYTDADMQIGFLENFAFNIIDSVIRDTIKIDPEITKDPSDVNKERFLLLFEKKIDELILAWQREVTFCPEFNEYTFELF